MLASSFLLALLVAVILAFRWEFLLRQILLLHSNRIHLDSLHHQARSTSQFSKLQRSRLIPLIWIPLIFNTVMDMGMDMVMPTEVQNTRLITHPVTHPTIQPVTRLTKTSTITASTQLA